MKKKKIAKKRFQVLSGGKPADNTSFKWLNSFWSNSIYDTYEEAVEHANKWLGSSALKNYHLNIPQQWGYDVSDTIEIREID